MNGNFSPNPLMQLKTQFSLGSFTIRWNWPIASCVLILVLALIRLGLWQLDRAAEKVDAAEAMLLEQQAVAEAIESIPAGHLHPSNPELPDRHVILSGEYLNERTILLLAEFFDDQIGYGVVTPFRLNSSGQLVLVQRGWTSGILPPATPPQTRPYQGPVTINAQIHVPPPDSPVIASEIDPSHWPIRMRSLELDVIGEILGEPLFPFAVRLTADQPGVLVRHWPAARPDINQHLFYALQWFGFAAVTLVIALLASSNIWQLLQGADPSIPDKIGPND